jgi:hypothetical protein
MTINITLTKAELLFMREAMSQKFNFWMQELDDAEEEYDTAPAFSLNAQQVQAMKDAGVWDDPIERSDIIQKYHNDHLRKQDDYGFDEQYYAWKKVEPEEVQKPKKPHWTQTAKGKKILAARKKAKK